MFLLAYNSSDREKKQSNFVEFNFPQKFLPLRYIILFLTLHFVPGALLMLKVARCQVFI